MFIRILSIELMGKR